MRVPGDPDPANRSWPPAPQIPWLGITDASEVLAVIWATVDLERALGDRTAAPGDRTAVPDDTLLGARVVLVAEADGRMIAIAEPSTEGRLAGTLARNGEGPAGWYVRTWARTIPWSARLLR